MVWFQVVLQGAGSWAWWYLWVRSNLRYSMIDSLQCFYWSCWSCPMVKRCSAGNLSTAYSEKHIHDTQRCYSVKHLWSSDFSSLCFLCFFSSAPWESNASMKGMCRRRKCTVVGQAGAHTWSWCSGLQPVSWIWVPQPSLQTEETRDPCLDSQISGQLKCLPGKWFQTSALPNPKHSLEHRTWANALTRT